MLTLHTLNQKLNQRGYHAMVILASNYGMGDKIILTKISNLNKPLISLDIDDLHHPKSDCCDYQAQDYLPDDIALLFKHFMEDTLKYGLKKVFNNHLKDFSPDSYIFYGSDGNYYYNHDEYTKKYYDYLKFKNFADDFSRVADIFANDMNVLRNYTVKDLSKDSQKQMNYLYNTMKKFLNK